MRLLIVAGSVRTSGDLKSCVPTSSHLRTPRSRTAPLNAVGEIGIFPSRGDFRGDVFE